MWRKRHLHNLGQWSGRCPMRNQFSLHNPVNCTAEQSRGENAALSDTGRGDETGRESSTDPDTWCGALMQIFN